MKFKLMQAAQILKVFDSKHLSMSVQVPEYYIVICDNTESPRSILRALIKSVYKMSDVDKEMGNVFREETIDQEYDLTMEPTYLDSSLKTPYRPSQHGLIKIDNLSNGMVDQYVIKWLEDAQPGYFETMVCVSIFTLQNRRLDIKIVGDQCFSMPNYYQFFSFTYHGKRLIDMLNHAHDLIEESK